MPECAPAPAQRSQPGGSVPRRGRRAARTAEHHAVVGARVPEPRPRCRGRASAAAGRRASAGDTRVSRGARRSACRLQIVALARLKSLGVRRVTECKGEGPSGRVGAEAKAVSYYLAQTGFRIPRRVQIT